MSVSVGSCIRSWRRTPHWFQGKSHRPQVVLFGFHHGLDLLLQVALS